MPLYFLDLTSHTMAVRYYFEAVIIEASMRLYNALFKVAGSPGAIARLKVSLLASKPEFIWKINNIPRVY